MYRTTLAPLQQIAIATSFIGNTVTRVGGCNGNTFSVIARFIGVAIAAHTATSVSATDLVSAIGYAIGSRFIAIVVGRIGPFFGFTDQRNGFAIKLFQFIVLAPDQNVVFALTKKSDVATASGSFDTLILFAGKIGRAFATASTAPIITAFFVVAVGLAYALIVLAR